MAKKQSKAEAKKMVKEAASVIEPDFNPAMAWRDDADTQMGHALNTADGPNHAIILALDAIRMEIRAANA